MCVSMCVCVRECVCEGWKIHKLHVCIMWLIWATPVTWDGIDYNSNYWITELWNFPPTNRYGFLAGPLGRTKSTNQIIPTNQTSPAPDLIQSGFRGSQAHGCTHIHKCKNANSLAAG